MAVISRTTGDLVTGIIVGVINFFLRLFGLGEIERD